LPDLIIRKKGDVIFGKMFALRIEVKKDPRKMIMLISNKEIHNLPFAEVRFHFLRHRQ